MPTRIPASYGRLLARLQLTGDPEPMVCTFGVGGLVDAALGQDAVDTFATLWSTEIMDIVCSSYVFTGAELAAHITPADETDDLAVFVSSAFSTAGGNTAAATPQNTAYLIHKRTAIAGKRYRGRVYLPGVGEPSVSPTGAVTGDLLTDIPTKFAALRTGMASNGTPLCLLHQAEAVMDAPAPTEITAFQLDAIVATQRRRLRR